MDLTVLGGAATIALASTIIFVLVVRSWTAFAHSTATSRFPDSIMLEAAQRFRDELQKLGHEQSVYLISALVFTVIFSVFYLLPPEGMFDEVPRWQLFVVLAVLTVVAAFVLYRLINIVIARRKILFIRDANMAIGHALQKLTAHRNRVFYDVQCHAGTIDNVVVGLHGIYAVSVIARKCRKGDVARLKDDQLMFSRKHVVSVKRSGAKSDRLAREFGKVVGHEVRVRSVIAIPGWEIDSQQSTDYLLVNERNLAMLTGWKEQKDFLMNEDVEAIHAMLTERCTRFRT